MARTSNPSALPPEAMTSGLPALAETAREVLEAANYAIAGGTRQVLFSLRAQDPGLLLPAAGNDHEWYYVPCWVDEDILQLEFQAYVGGAGSGTWSVTLNDGTTDHTTVAGVVTWTNPLATTSGQGQVQLFKVTVHRLTGTGDLYLNEVRLRAVVRAASSLLAAGE